MAIGETFVDYNERRTRSSLGYLTPYEYLDTGKTGRLTIGEKANLEADLLKRRLEKMGTALS